MSVRGLNLFHYLVFTREHGGWEHRRGLYIGAFINREVRNAYWCFYLHLQGLKMGRRVDGKMLG